MKWTNHKLSAGITAVAFGTNLIETACVLFGSYLPDYIEMIIAGTNKTRWNKIHRKFFHWWLLYFVYMGIVTIMGENYLIGLTKYIAAGAYLHIIGDALTMQGVPALNPKKCELAIGCFTTGSNKEYKYTLIYFFTVLIFILIFKDFNLYNFMNEDNTRITKAIQDLVQLLSYRLTH